MSLNNWLKVTNNEEKLYKNFYNYLNNSKNPLSELINILKQTKLEKDILNKIWVNTIKDNSKLLYDEFILVIKCVSIVLNGKKINKETLENEQISQFVLKYGNQKIINLDNLLLSKYKNIIKSTKTETYGVLRGSEAQKLYLNNNSELNILREIWNICDKDIKGFLEFPEFILFLYLLDFSNENKYIPLLDIHIINNIKDNLSTEKKSYFNEDTDYNDKKTSNDILYNNELLNLIEEQLKEKDLIIQNQQTYISELETKFISFITESSFKLNNYYKNYKDTLLNRDKDFNNFYEHDKLIITKMKEESIMYCDKLLENIKYFIKKDEIVNKYNFQNKEIINKEFIITNKVNNFIYKTINKNNNFTENKNYIVKLKSKSLNQISDDIPHFNYNIYSENNSVDNNFDVKAYDIKKDNANNNINNNKNKENNNINSFEINNNTINNNNIKNDDAKLNINENNNIKINEHINENIKDNEDNNNKNEHIIVTDDNNNNIIKNDIDFNMDNINKNKIDIDKSLTDKSRKYSNEANSNENYDNKPAFITIDKKNESLNNSKLNDNNNSETKLEENNDIFNNRTEILDNDNKKSEDLFGNFNDFTPDNFEIPDMFNNFK